MHLAFQKVERSAHFAFSKEQGQRSNAVIIWLFQESNLVAPGFPTNNSAHARLAPN
jgi:hypothetical protein